jgi:hypothetical protein
MPKDPPYYRTQRAYPLAGRVCEDCGAPATDRHHLDRDVANTAPANIVFLCERHHGARHRLASCNRGHDLSDPANTYTDPRGRRFCRECRRENDRALHARRRDERNAARKARAERGR